jgi:hypothetical protein
MHYSKFQSRSVIQGLMLAVSLVSVATAQATSTDIYRSYDPGSKAHIYSDHPLNRTSQLFAVFDGHQLWPRSGGGPISTAELIARRAELDP